MFERFTEQARAVIGDADAQAKALGHERVGPEHFVLGLVRSTESGAGEVLRARGVTEDVFRARLLESVGKDESEPLIGIESLPSLELIPAERGDPIPQIAEARRSLAVRVDPSLPVHRLLMSAGACALDDGRTQIDIDDIWVALTREPTAISLASLLGVDEVAVREAINRRDLSAEPPEASAGG